MDQLSVGFDVKRRSSNSRKLIVPGVMLFLGLLMISAVVAPIVIPATLVAYKALLSSAIGILGLLLFGGGALVLLKSLFL